MGLAQALKAVSGAKDGTKGLKTLAPDLETYNSVFKFPLTGGFNSFNFFLLKQKCLLYSVTSPPHVILDVGDLLPRFTGAYTGRAFAVR